MARVLVLYATTDGQTEDVARYFAEDLATFGHDVVLEHLTRKAPELVLDDFDGIVIAASIHMGKHQPIAVRWAEEHRALLEERAAALLSVSLSAATHDKDRDTHLKEILDHFIEDSGWTPPLVAFVGGAIRFQDYGPIKRWMMRKIAEDAGLDADTSKNHSYTDWFQVDRFADAFDEVLP